MRDKYLKWFICIVFLLAFILISINVLNDKVFVIDEFLYGFMDDYLINGTMTLIMKFITWFGGTVGIIFMCVLSLLIFKDKKINTAIVCNLIIVTILNNLFKIIFMRARPDINSLVIETSYSFPSGHSMMSMILYGYFNSYITYRY